MNVNIASNAQLMNLTKLPNSSCSSGSSNNNTSLSVNTSSTNSGTNQPRFALSINNNVANINSALLRNVQLSPNQLKNSKFGISLSQQQQQQSTQNLSVSNLQNYTLNLQNQINYAALNLSNQQQQQQLNSKLQQSNTQQNSTLLAAASVLAANNIAAQMYQPMQQATCNLNNTLFVGNLHASLQEIDLIQVFRPFGRIVECCKKWLHFGFVKFTTEEEACHAYVTLNGFRLKGRPMRLEFQNRTKKARIKAILAQAALQAANGTQCNNDLLSMSNVNIAGVGVQLGSMGAFPNFIDDRQQLQNMQNQQNVYYQTSNQTNPSQFNPNHKLEQSTQSVFTKQQENSSFFNSDQLIKFASGKNDLETKDKQFELNFDLTESNNYYDLNNVDYFESKLNEDLMKDVQLYSSDSKRLFSANDDLLMSLLNKPKQVSPSDSPTHEALSLSSDSGCRSNSFINDEDSAITSIQSTIRISKKSLIENGKKKLEDCTISEHLEFTCSKSSPIKEEKEEMKLDEENEDEIEADEVQDVDEDDDDDCSSDCDTSDDASDMPSESDGDSDCLNDLDMLDENFLNENGDYNEIEIEVREFNQVIENDGSISRKKLESGIYKCVNQTLSLFIEPNDILKKIDAGEYDEYNLFPNDVEKTLDSILLIKNHLFKI